MSVLHYQSHSQNDSGDLRGVAGGDGELGCLCGKAGTSHLCDGSAHSSGCVVNGYSALSHIYQWHTYNATVCLRMLCTVGTTPSPTSLLISQDSRTSQERSSTVTSSAEQPATQAREF